MTQHDRIPQRGSSPSSSYPQSPSPRCSDSSQQPRSSLQARSPSPDLDNFTCTQMDCDIVAMKALIHRRRDSSNSTGNDDGPSKRRYALFQAHSETRDTESYMFWWTGKAVLWPNQDEGYAKSLIPSGKCISRGQMISNHVEYFTWFDMIIEMRVSFYKNQII